VLSRADAGRMYVAFDNHRNDDYRAYLFGSDDGGATWRAMTDGIPETAVRALCEDPSNPDLLFAGTERGLYVSLDRGRAWHPLGDRLPDVPVFDVTVQPRDHELLVATHGRGIYIVDVAPLEQWSDAVAAAPAHVFDPGPAIAYNFLEHRDFLAQGTYVGGNGPQGAVIYYNLAAAADHPVLRVSDERGVVVRELEVDGAPGVHRAEWDLRLAPLPMPHRPTTEGVNTTDTRPAESTHARVPGDYGGGGDPTGGEAGAAPDAPRGPMVLPGRYRVTLVADHAEASATVRVVQDPRVHVDEGDLLARWKLLDKAYDTQRTSIPAANRALALRDAVAAAVKALDAAGEAPGDLKTYAEETAKLTRQAQGRVNRANGQVGSVARDVSGSTTRPTEAQEGQLAAALEDLQPAVERMEQLAKERIPELNRRLEAAGFGRWAVESKK